MFINVFFDTWFEYNVGVVWESEWTQTHSLFLIYNNKDKTNVHRHIQTPIFKHKPWVKTKHVDSKSYRKHTIM